MIVLFSFQVTNFAKLVVIFYFCFVNINCRKIFFVEKTKFPVFFYLLNKQNKNFRLDCLPPPLGTRSSPTPCRRSAYAVPRCLRWGAQIPPTPTTQAAQADRQSRSSAGHCSRDSPPCSRDCAAPWNIFIYGTICKPNIIIYIEIFKNKH